MNARPVALRTAWAIACLTVALGSVALATSAAPAREGSPLRVFAAASLTEFVAGVVDDYEGSPIQTSFGASSTLARQIRDGAPADVFLSASPAWIAFLREANALEGEPLVVARNALVCIASAGSRLVDLSPAGPRALLEAIGGDGRVAIANEGVPAGEYARAALAHAGVLDAFRPHLVGQTDVRAVLHAVELGELPAGFVYATDAKLAADVTVLFVFDRAAHPPIEYQAAVVRGTARPEEARRFLAHLRSAPARARLAGAGFALP